MFVILSFVIGVLSHKALKPTETQDSADVHLYHVVPHSKNAAASHDGYEHFVIKPPKQVNGILDGDFYQIQCTAQPPIKMFPKSTSYADGTGTWCDCEMRSNQPDLIPPTFDSKYSLASVFHRIGTNTGLSFLKTPHTRLVKPFESCSNDYEYKSYWKHDDKTNEKGECLVQVKKYRDDTGDPCHTISPPMEVAPTLDQGNVIIHTVGLKKDTLLKYQDFPNAKYQARCEGKCDCKYFEKVETTTRQVHWNHEVHTNANGECLILIKKNPVESWNLMPFARKLSDIPLELETAPSKRPGVVIDNAVSTEMEQVIVTIPPPEPELAPMKVEDGFVVHIIPLKRNTLLNFQNYDAPTARYHVQCEQNHKVCDCKITETVDGTTKAIEGLRGYQSADPIKDACEMFFIKPDKHKIKRTVIVSNYDSKNPNTKVSLFAVPLGSPQVTDIKYPKDPNKKYLLQCYLRPIAGSSDRYCDCSFISEKAREDGFIELDKIELEGEFTRPVNKQCMVQILNVRQARQRETDLTVDLAHHDSSDSLTVGLDETYAIRETENSILCKEERDSCFCTYFFKGSPSVLSGAPKNNQGKLSYLPALPPRHKTPSQPFAQCTLILEKDTA